MQYGISVSKGMFGQQLSNCIKRRHRNERVVRLVVAGSQVKALAAFLAGKDRSFSGNPVLELDLARAYVKIVDELIN